MLQIDLFFNELKPVSVYIQEPKTTVFEVGAFLKADTITEDSVNQIVEAARTMKSQMQFVSLRGKYSQSPAVNLKVDRPLNLHQSLARGSCVTGDYLYFHYLQDGTNDNGWGCAYRSLQTLMSHSMLNYGSTKGYDRVPSLHEIQKALVEMEDKPPSHYGSTEWLGAYEVCLCMSYFLDVDC